MLPPLGQHSPKTREESPAMEWMLLPYKRYADFSGRSCRKEFWMFLLLNIIVFVVLGGMTLSGLIRRGMQPQVAGTSLMAGSALVLYWLLTLIPYIAVHVRRFHDQDKSGWFYLLAFIPYVGTLVVLVFMALRGTHGVNRFGDDPLDPGLITVFS
jgi:uncharacterized membrane protein YhaH (DUF805 family)